MCIRDRCTFDNSATNAAGIDLMLRGELDESVLVAFTGDEAVSYTHLVKLRTLGRLPA